MGNFLPGLYLQEYGPSYRLISEVTSCDEELIVCACSLDCAPLNFLGDHLKQGMIVPGAILIEACGQSAFLLNAINEADAVDEGLSWSGVLAKIESATFSKSVMRDDPIIIETKKLGFRAGFSKYSSRVVVSGQKAAKTVFYSKRIRR